MKFFKLGLFFGLLFTQCFGMEFFPIFNPQIIEVLKQLKTKDADQTLQPEEFWAIMAAYTGMGSCFLGESLANITEKDICLILKYLIKFGKEDKNKFYECITGCTGCDGITPLNELIRRMPEVPSEDSAIYKLFSELLDLINTLEMSKKSYILDQKDLYGKEPVLTALKENKPYIVRAVTGISPRQ